MPIGSSAATAIAAATTAGARIFGSIKSAQTARRNTLATIRARKELAKYEFSQRKQMWREMLKYNTPAAQMRRFKAAGLNPNLIYGQGTPGNAQSFPRYQAPAISYQFQSPFEGFGRSIESGISTYMGLRQTDAEIALTQERYQAQVIENRILSLSVPGKEVEAMKAEIIEYVRESGGRVRSGDALITSVGGAYSGYMMRVWNEHIAKMKTMTLNKIHQELMNEYQSLVNRFAEKGISIKDNAKVRALMKLLNSVRKFLGYEPVTLTPE